MNNIQQVIFLTVVLLYLISIQIFGQLSISGELRTRNEYRHGYKQILDSGKVPSFFIGQRSRIKLYYKHEKYHIGISIQDVRVWGDEAYYSSTGINGDYASLDLKEAWCEYFLNKYTSFKLGKQELKYDDQRLLGARNWNQNGMSYNALLIKYKNIFQLDIGLSYNNNRENNYGQEYSSDKMKIFNFLYFNKKPNEKLDISLLLISSGYQKPQKANGIFLKNTCGTYINYKLDKFLITGSGYYQFGLNKSGNEVSAYMWSTDLSYLLNKHRLSIGTDYLSGQNFLSPDSAYLKKDHAFDILYGGRHRFYGSLDYFSNLSKGTAEGGLVDIFFKTQFQIINDLKLCTDFHFFVLQNKVADPNNQTTTPKALNKYLGPEIDLKFEYVINNTINLESGYSFFFPTESLKIIQETVPAEKFPQWAYIMFTIKPVFL